jgi:MscS family membrane protein
MSIADYIPYFGELGKNVQVLVINLMAIAAALVVIWIMRSFVLRFLLSSIQRIAGRTTFTHDDQIVSAIERPLRIAVVGVGILVLTAILNFTPDVDLFAENLGKALLFAATTFFFYNLVDVVGISSTTLRSITGLQVADRLLPFMRTVVKVFIVVMGFLIVLETFGYDSTGLIASFGIVGLAFSLAAQDTAANVFGFTAIVSDNPFEVGDYIVSGDFAGTVEQVGVRSTRIRKLDQSLVNVPNSKLTDSAVTNWSRLTKRRMDFMIGLTYDTNAEQMREVVDGLRDLLKAQEDVDPESVIVHFVEFGGSSLDIRLIAYFFIVDWGEFTAKREYVNLQIMELIESMGLGFAFPSRSLYIETLPRTENGAAIENRQALRQQRVERQAPQPEGKAEETYQDNPTESSENYDDSDAR